MRQKIPKTVTYRGKRRAVLGHYYSQEIALKVADEKNAKVVYIPRYDPAYLVITRATR